jgi:two-component system, OmpR family, response regulator
MKILYIEDEQNIAKPVINVLKSKGYMVDHFENGKAGLNSALVNKYNCILLDLNLPEIDGIEIAKKIREEKIETPIIMLTARSTINDKLDGFNIGADDYLPKPFEILELLARIEVRVRKSFLNNEVELLVGDWKFDPNTNRVHAKKEDIELSNKESQLLEYLLRRKGKVVSSTELLDYVWDTNVDILTDTVKTHIKTLRKKLKEKASLIKTIKGKGYIYEY